MINANVVFWFFVVLIAFVGASRGWIREVLVMFSMIFALFVLSFFKAPIDSFSAGWSLENRWFLKAIPFLVITLFGYAGPALTRNKVASGSGKYQEGLLAFLIGGFNGWMIFSSLAYFANEVGILRGESYAARGTTLFTRPAAQNGWDSFFFISNSAVTYFSGTTLVLVLIALVLFVLIVVI